MYELYYNPTTGKRVGILRLSDNTSFLAVEGNSDYQDFLKWNTAQPKESKLDLNSTIEVVKPEPVRDLAAELDIAKADIVKLKAGKMDKV